MSFHFWHSQRRISKENLITVITYLGMSFVFWLICGGIQSSWVGFVILFRWCFHLYDCCCLICLSLWWFVGKGSLSWALSTHAGVVPGDQLMHLRRGAVGVCLHDSYRGLCGAASFPLPRWCLRLPFWAQTFCDRYNCLWLTGLAAAGSQLCC